MNQTDQDVDLIQHLFEAINAGTGSGSPLAFIPIASSVGRPRCRMEARLPRRRRDLAGWKPGPRCSRTEVEERAISPQVVATAGNAIVVRWHQRGRNAAGDTIDTPVLSSYTIEDGRLRHAEMFYFDLLAVDLFLDVSTRRHD